MWADSDPIKRSWEESSYKSHNSAEVNVKSLSDDNSSEEEENISENGDKEEYVFQVKS